MTTREWLLEGALFGASMPLDRFLLLTLVIKLEKDMFNIASHLILRARTLVQLEQCNVALADLISAAGLLAALTRSLVPTASSLSPSLSSTASSSSTASPHASSSHASSPHSPFHFLHHTDLYERLVSALYLHFKVTLQKLAATQLPQSSLSLSLQCAWNTAFHCPLLPNAPPATHTTPATPIPSKTPTPTPKCQSNKAKTKEEEAPDSAQLLGRVFLRPSPRTLPLLSASYAQVPPSTPSKEQRSRVEPQQQKKKEDQETTLLPFCILPSPTTPTSLGRAERTPTRAKMARPLSVLDIALPDLEKLRLDEESPPAPTLTAPILLSRLTTLCDALEKDDVVENMPDLTPDRKSVV